MKIPFWAKMAASVGAALALVAGAYLFSAGYFNFNKAAISSPSTASTTPQIATPDYTQPINFSSSLDASVKAQLSQQLSDLQLKLKANPLDLKSWLNLGAVYKIGGDYPHALAAWGFVIDTLPTGQAAYFNRADLYMNFLKDYPAAEADYKKIISMNPNVIDAYQDLFYLYRDLYKTNTSNAKNILEEGIKNNPGNAQLAALLSEYNQSNAH